MSEVPRKKIRDLGTRAQALGKLKDHPSWAVLEDTFEKTRAAYLDSLSRKLIAGGIDAAPLDQRQLDYKRGFWAGAKAVLDNPDDVQEALEAALRKEKRV